MKRSFIFIWILIIAASAIATIYTDLGSSGTYVNTWFNSSCSLNGCVQLNGTNTSGSYRNSTTILASDLIGLNYTDLYCSGKELLLSDGSNHTGCVNNVSTTKLIAYYNMNNRTDDLSGNGFDATRSYLNITRDTEGKFRSSGYYDGNNNYFNTSYQPTMENGFNTTFNAWIKTTSNLKRCIIGSVAEAGVNDPTIFLQVDDGATCGVGQAHFFSRGSGSGLRDEVCSNTIVNDNQWHMITGVAGNITTSIYVDGILEESIPTSIGGGLRDFNNYPFYIGSNNNRNGALLNPFLGYIDEVSIWNRTLSSEEIRNLYLRGATRLNISVKSKAGDMIDLGQLNTSFDLQDARFRGITSLDFMINFSTDNSSFNSLTPSYINASTFYTIWKLYGDYVNTIYNTTDDFIQLYRINETGNFTSNITDLGLGAVLNEINITREQYRNISLLDYWRPIAGTSYELNLLFEIPTNDSLFIFSVYNPNVTRSFKIDRATGEITESSIYTESNFFPYIIPLNISSNTYIVQKDDELQLRYIYPNGSWSSALTSLDTGYRIFSGVLVDNNTILTALMANSDLYYGTYKVFEHNLTIHEGNTFLEDGGTVSSLTADTLLERNKSVYIYTYYEVDLDDSFVMTLYINDSSQVNKVDKINLDGTSVGISNINHEKGYNFSVIYTDSDYCSYHTILNISTDGHIYQENTLNNITCGIYQYYTIKDSFLQDKEDLFNNSLILVGLKNSPTFYNINTIKIEVYEENSSFKRVIEDAMPGLSNQRYFNSKAKPIKLNQSIYAFNGGDGNRDGNIYTFDFLGEKVRLSYRNCSQPDCSDAEFKRLPIDTNRYDLGGITGQYFQYLIDFNKTDSFWGYPKFYNLTLGYILSPNYPAVNFTYPTPDDGTTLEGVSEININATCIQGTSPLSYINISIRNATNTFSQINTTPSPFNYTFVNLNYDTYNISAECVDTGALSNTTSRTVTTTADATKPIFITIPANYSGHNETNMFAQFTCFDISGIDNYLTNSTLFIINGSGYLTNSTDLFQEVGYYTVNVSCNDTAGNFNFTLYGINIIAAPPPTNISEGLAERIEELEADKLNIYDILFIAFLIGCIGITIAKTYNVMKKGEFYGIEIVWILAIGYIIFWFFGLTALLTNPKTIYATLFILGSLLLFLNALYLVIELMLYYGNIGYQEAYKPKRN